MEQRWWGRPCAKRGGEQRLGCALLRMTRGLKVQLPMAPGIWRAHSGAWVMQQQGAPTTTRLAAEHACNAPPPLTLVQMMASTPCVRRASALALNWGTCLEEHTLV